MPPAFPDSSQASSSTSTPLPTLTPESLSLSASLFASQIDAWIPASFGVRQSDAEKQAAFTRAFKSVGGGGGGGEEKTERLGVGHPLLDAPQGRSGAGGRGKGGALGTADLARRLEGKGKGRATGEELGNGVDGRDEEDEEEQEESRSRVVGSKVKRRGMNGVADLLAGRKKKKKKPSLHSSAATTTGPSHSSTQTPAPAASPPAHQSPTMSTSPLPPPTPIVWVKQSIQAESSDPLLLKSSPSNQSPRPLSNGQSPMTKAKTSEVLRNGSAQEEDEGFDGETGQGEKGLTKTQERREKRRRAKLARAARDQQQQR